MKTVAIGVGLGALVSTSTALATPDGFGVSLGGRLAFALPSGHEHDGLSMSGDGFSNAAVLQADALARLSRRVGVGLYGSYARLGMDSSAVAGSSTALDLAGHWWKTGLQIIWKASSSERTTPWVGYGIGLERVRFTATTAGTATGGGLDGYEWVKLQAGLDFPCSTVAAFGPFLDLSLGQYGKSYAGDASASIDHKAWHEWLSLGAHGVFDL